MIIEYLGYQIRRLNRATIEVSDGRETWQFRNWTELVRWMARRETQ